MSSKVGLRPINIGRRRPFKKGVGEIPFYIGLKLRFDRAKRARLEPARRNVIANSKPRTKQEHFLIAAREFAPDTLLAGRVRHETCGQIAARISRKKMGDAVDIRRAVDFRSQERVEARLYPRGIPAAPAFNR